MIKTVPKNTKRAKAVFEKATKCTSYSLSNSFDGQDCDPKYAEKALHEGHRAKLTDNGGGKFTVHCHSNLWYELTAEGV